MISLWCFKIACQIHCHKWCTPTTKEESKSLALRIEKLRLMWVCPKMESIVNPDCHFDTDHDDEAFLGACHFETLQPQPPSAEVPGWKTLSLLRIPEIGTIWMAHIGRSGMCCNMLKLLETDMAVCQNLVPLVNIKIAGKWMFIPLKMVLIGIDPYPYSLTLNQHITFYIVLPDISADSTSNSLQLLEAEVLQQWRSLQPDGAVFRVRFLAVALSDSCAINLKQGISGYQWDVWWSDYVGFHKSTSSDFRRNVWMPRFPWWAI